jgi:hypothetical protein
MEGFPEVQLVERSSQGVGRAEFISISLGTTERESGKRAKQ